MGKPSWSRFDFFGCSAKRERQSTQTQALSALLFLYKDVLGLEFPWLDEVTRAKKPVRLPTVLTADEVKQLFKYLDDP